MTISLKERLEDSIAREEQAGALPADAGLAIAVVRGGQPLLRATYGLRERDRVLPVTTSTSFEIGSLTKAFTATALMVAADDGAIDLEAPLNAAEPLLVLSDAAVSRQVTIADVLAHRTGVTANDLAWSVGGARGDRLERALARFPVIPGAFRQSFLYNNVLYGVLGARFPRLVGEDWESFLTRRVLGPLGMLSTSFRAPSGTDAALPYVGTRRIASADVSAVVAGGGLRSTLDDMVRWLALWTRRGSGERRATPLSEAARTRMLTGHVRFGDANPIILSGLEWATDDLQYGLGWFLGRSAGSPVAFHPGFIDGFSSAIAVLPEQQLGVVVLANVNFTGAPGRLVRDLLSDLSGAPASHETVAGPSADAEGGYENPVFGALAIVRRGTRWAIDYEGCRWPLRWTDGITAEVSGTVFGLQIPFPLTLTVHDGRVEGLSIPLAMDPRVDPQHFVRRLAR